MPLSADWNGWLNFYDPYGQRKDQEQQQQPAAQSQQTQQQPQQQQQGHNFGPNDEIPF